MEHTAAQGEGPVSDEWRLSVDGVSPARDGLCAWLESLATPGDSGARVRLLAASASWASLAFSSPSCLCRDLRQTEHDMRRGLASLGYRVEALTGGELRLKGARDRIGRYLERGRLVPWFLGDEEGVIWRREEPGFRVRFVTLDGAIGERLAQPDELAAARLYLVRPAPSLREPRMLHDVHTLLEAAARWLLPHAHGGFCPRCEGTDIGLAAMERARTAHRTSQAWAQDVPIARVRHARWTGRVSDGCAVLERLGIAASTARGTRVRYAHACLADALEDLRAAARAFTEAAAPAALPAAFGTYRCDIDDACYSIQGAFEWITAVACLRGRLPVHYRDLLFSGPAEPTPAGHLADLTYLARAGSPPFRRLAARRLGGLRGERSAATTVRQLLHDPDDMTALMAAGALLQLSQDAPHTGFLDAYARRTASDPFAPFSIRAELLHDAALTEPDRTAAFLSDAGDEWRDDFSPAGVARVEALLNGAA